MADIETLLKRWQSAGVLETQAADRVRAWEAQQKRPTGLRWQGMVALILGALLLASGVVLFVSAHWDELGPAARFALVIAMVTLFHAAGAYTRKTFRGLSAALHAVGTASAGAAIALVGQIFNIQEHWPAAILLWTLAALAGWILLRDQAQETFTLLLFPAWLICEISDATGHHGAIYLGQFLVVWAVLYLTVFLRSRHRVVQGLLFAAAAVAAVAGTWAMVAEWYPWDRHWPISPWTITWAWGAIAVLPLLGAFLRFSRSMVPVTAAVGYAFVLPRIHGSSPDGSIAAQALVAAFAVFLMWWGVRQASRALVNFGIVGFAITVVWFYFSDIFDKVGRSLGLIGIGILFLAGGWALEKTRRRLVARMTPQAAAPGEAR
jgi:uncharacterized membrane protein